MSGYYRCWQAAQPLPCERCGDVTNTRAQGYDLDGDAVGQAHARCGECAA